jgi:uncharacterized membrane protein YphA (DoxX/SURF4 family)
MRVFANICRILTGMVFVLSGFVKGVDPLGTSYRLEDYFQVFHATWLLPYALFFSILLCTFEFVLGMALIFSIRLKVTAWILLFVSGFFTILTFFDALYNTVPDCGCFGDALKLTNWETFYKNIFLMILAVIIFSRRKRTVPCFLPKNEVRFTSLVISLFAVFCVYAYTMLPVIDFLPFKTGSRLISKEATAPQIYLTYKNKKTGETKEYLSPNFPWKDKVWMAEWEYVSQKVNTVSENDLIYIQDIHSLDVTREVLGNVNGTLLIVSYDLQKAHIKALTKVIELGNQATRQYLKTVLLTSSAGIYNSNIWVPVPMHFEFYNADDVQLKMLVRANPGVVLIKDGVVMGKWSSYDLPTVNKMYEILLKKPAKSK